MRRSSRESSESSSSNRSPCSGTVSAPESRAVMLRSSRSTISVLCMVTPHQVSKRLQCAELQLLDGSFRTLEFRGDVADAALFDEAPNDDQPLIFRKFIDELIEERAVFDGRCVMSAVGIVAVENFLALRLLPAIGHAVGCDAQQ